MYLYVKLNMDAYCFFEAESEDCMNSASYEYRNKSTKWEMCPLECWLSVDPPPPNTAKMLSTRNSSILIMSSSLYLLFESECCTCIFHWIFVVISISPAIFVVGNPYVRTYLMVFDRYVAAIWNSKELYMYDIWWFYFKYLHIENENYGW